jgi:hypothetical protein
MRMASLGVTVSDSPQKAVVKTVPISGLPLSPIALRLREAC